MSPSTRCVHHRLQEQHLPRYRELPKCSRSVVSYARGRRRKNALKVDETVPLPHVDYGELLSRSEANQPPALFLAPMENLADRPFRVAFNAAIGGFDEACTEFIRIPCREADPYGMARGLARLYSGRELGTAPLGAQIMGSHMPVMEGLVPRLIANGAPRIDLNCGCPAGTVTGKGAGSSMLRDPGVLHELVADLVRLADGRVPVSVKMRSGFEDTSLFEDNLLALQEAGVSFVTIHPRTRNQGYNGRADWSLIAKAKDTLSIPVIGNGDVVSVEAALSMHAETGCNGIMIGRGAVQDPFIFHRVRAAFGGSGGAALLEDEPAALSAFLRTFARHVFDTTTTDHAAPSRMKQLAAYLFISNQQMQRELKVIQRKKPSRAEFGAFVDHYCAIVEQHWVPGGLRRTQLVNHMTLAKDKTRPNKNMFQDASAKEAVLVP